MKTKYYVNYHNFVRMMTGVKLTFENWRTIFSNLSEEEFDVWVNEVQSAYAGSDYEFEASCIDSVDMMAEFWFNHPITD